SAPTQRMPGAIRASVPPSGPTPKGTSTVTMRKKARLSPNPPPARVASLRSRRRSASMARPPRGDLPRGAAPDPGVFSPGRSRSCEGPVEGIREAVAPPRRGALRAEAGEVERCGLGEAEVDMGCHERRAARREVGADGRGEHGNRGRVERDRGFVEKPEPAAGHEQPREAEAALLPGREVLRRAVRQGAEIHRGDRRGGVTLPIDPGPEGEVL